MESISSTQIYSVRNQRNLERSVTIEDSWLQVLVAFPRGLPNMLLLPKATFATGHLCTGLLESFPEVFHGGHPESGNPVGERNGVMDSVKSSSTAR